MGHGYATPDVAPFINGAAGGFESQWMSWFVLARLASDAVGLFPEDRFAAKSRGRFTVDAGGEDRCDLRAGWLSFRVDGVCWCGVTPTFPYPTCSRNGSLLSVAGGWWCKGGSHHWQARSLAWGSPCCGNTAGRYSRGLPA